MVAFPNGTAEPFRMFFVGKAGARFHEQQEVTFQDLEVDPNRWTKSGLG
jgi:hypothetical protein